MRRAKTTSVEPMPEHSPAMSRMVGKGKKSKKMMMKEDSESECEMEGGRIELSKLIGLGKDGQHYMIDPSMFATKPRVPLPRDNVSGKGRRVLEGGVLGAYDPSVEYRDTLSGSGKAKKSEDNFWANFGTTGSTQDIATATTSKGPSMRGMGKAGAGTLKITHEGMGSRGAGKTDGRKRRAEIVKKVMMDRGIKSLAEASKIVKAEGLY